MGFAIWVNLTAIMVQNTPELPTTNLRTENDKTNLSKNMSNMVTRRWKVNGQAYWVVT